MSNIILKTGIEALSLFLMIIMFWYHKKINKLQSFDFLKGIYITAALMAVANISEICASALNFPTWSLYFVGALNDICPAVMSLMWFSYNLIQLEKELSSFKKLAVLIIFVIGVILSPIYSILPYILLTLSAFIVISMSCYGWKNLTKAQKEKHINITFASLVLLTGCVLKLISDDLSFITPMLILGLLIHLLSELYNKIVTDELTKIKNRYGMDEEFEEQLIQYNKDKTDSFYIIACDMDNFKSINDDFGHDEGDRALRLISEILSRITEKNNATAFRNGGDEFIIITDKTDGNVAEKICEELGKEFEALHFRDDFKIKMSMGIALFDGKASIKELLIRADQFLYDEKRRRKSDK